MANEFLQEATKMLTSQTRKKEWYEGQFHEVLHDY
jgi:hypothetical protein